MLLLVSFGYLLPQILTMTCNDACIDTVAILAQGTSWAVADMQAFCQHTDILVGHGESTSLDGDKKMLMSV